MESVVVSSSSFVKPHFIDELGCEGLSLHEVAQSLGIEFKHVKEKFERMVAANRVKSLYDVYTAYNENNRLVESYLLATDTAKFFVAKWDSDLGDAYCRFLIECEKAVESLAELSPELRFLIKLEKQQKQQQQQLQILEATMQQVDSSLGEATLSSAQIAELENLFSQLRRVSGEDHRLVSRTKGALKAQFLSCCKTGMTYKDIAQKHFASCKEMVMTQIKSATTT